MKKWLEDNLTIPDLLIFAVLLVGVIALLAGVKEIATAALGSATTYVVKDKTKAERLRKEIEEERGEHDAHLEKAVEDTRARTMDSALPDLVDSANRRIGGTD